LIAGATLFGGWAGSAISDGNWEKEISRCADTIITTNPDERAAKCPADIDRAIVTLEQSVEKDVAETKVEYRDRIVPVIDKSAGVERRRADRLQDDLNELQELYDAQTTCSSSDAMLLLRSQLCDLTGGCDAALYGGPDSD
jgi:hypothetical protein